MAKPFLEPKTYKKVKFVYSDDNGTKKIMEDLFNVDELDCAFGGNNQVSFNIDDYAARMREDDKRMPLLWKRSNSSSSDKQLPATTPDVSLGKSASDSDEPEKEIDGQVRNN